MGTAAWRSRNLSAVVLGVVLSAGTAGSAAGISYDSVHLVGRTTEGRHFELTIRTTEYAEAGSDLGRVDFIGTDGWSPSRVISEFKLAIDSRPLSLPRDAYREIADPHLAGLQISADGAVLELVFKGGDGSASYAVRFHFVDGGLQWREVSQFDPEGEWVSRRQSY